MKESIRAVHQPNNITASLFPDDVLTIELVPARVRGALHPEEVALISRARENRKQEFMAGRLGARELMARFGIHDYPLLSGKSREPLWPEKVVGCISHTRDLCAVAVAQREAYNGLGLDLESMEGVKKKMWPHLFLPEEQIWLEKKSEHEQAGYAALIFSAKECFYKCQFTLTREWLHFKEARIIVDPSNHQFEVKLLSGKTGAFNAGERFKGSYRFYEGRVYTGMVYGARS
ncbi:MAG: 4'-phosphopantetheinyl transferase superfamily protein [Planctomycetes bacterium]|nr:4'-phosphopantetheinyl transferase superfamily protein [Planctomycetota bacterium]